MALDREELALGAARVVQHGPRAAPPQHIGVRQQQIKFAQVVERLQPLWHRAHQLAVALVVPARGSLPLANG